MKAIRALAASCTLLIASFAAHILAGGNSLSLHSSLSLTLFSIVIATLLIRKSGDPIRVALAIFIAQNAGHFILGGQASSETQMLLAHCGAGALSYHLLRYFDRNLPDLGRALISLLTPSLPDYIVTFTHLILIPRISFQRNTHQHFLSAYSLRGPPLH